MKNIPANNIQRITLIIAMLLGLNLTTTTVFAQDANASEKIQLMSEALLARDAGELLLAKEKVEMLIALAPNDTNVQNLLLSINQSIEDEGLIVPNASDAEVEADQQVSGKFAFIKKIQQVSQSKLLPVEEVSPVFAEQSSEVENLLLIARSQIAAGDLASATSTIEEIEARNPNSKEAKLLAIKLSQALEGIQGLNLYKTRANMLNSVDNSWEQAKVFELENTDAAAKAVVPTLFRKLENIVLPKVNFTGMALTRVIETLSELSVQYDPEGQGVNMVALFDSSEFNPKVNITLRNLSLDKILQFVTQQVNFTYDVGQDAVTIQASDSIGGSSSTLTEFFPLSRATVIRLTGLRDTSSSSSESDDPFGDTSISLGESQDQEKNALQKFFQNAGVNFEGVTGASLAFDGEQLIVTQTPRNLERLRTILRNYTEIKQVEIEAKFLEVAQGDLDELGFHWGVESIKTDEDWVIGSNMRSLSDLAATSNSTSRVRVGDKSTDPTGGITIQEYFPLVDSNGNPGDPVYSSPPKISETLSFGTAANFFKDSFLSGDLDLDLEIRALARRTGSDLMSAPKVTVLSGKQADITVAQELRYPQSYGDIESTVSSGGGGGGTGGGSSNAAVSITAGTPQDFTTRNVGVEMSVTPNVGKDNTIALKLTPRVTEFEGFVEYGGPSIALAGDTTAIIPAGFYQPIFSTREISTEVIIYDGATVVMGGLTRDQISSVNDKVPFLGDIPGIGRLFRSEGETRQKRNLLIFVTANLVTPGGSLSNQSYDNIKGNTIYQSPSLATPAGSKFRNVTIAD
jgi:general secretion pathway protein D